MEKSNVRLSDSPPPSVNEDLTPSICVSALVHDLKTPIQVMLGWASRLRRDTVDARQNTIITIIERNCHLLDHLADQLRAAVVHPETRPSMWRAPVNLTELLLCTIEGLRPSGEASQIDLVVLPSPAVVVAGDVCSLTRVIANLVSNAIKFSVAPARVECAVQARPDVAALVVRDYGAGISADFMPDVFEPFYREGASGVAGTGLGLAVVRQIVRAHGGEVSVESGGRGGGCTVTVTLPYEQGE